MNHTIFDDIVSGTVKSWKVWEDEQFLAFLTPFPNTPGSAGIRGDGRGACARQAVSATW